MKNYIECGTLELCGAICSLYSILSCGILVLEYANYNMNRTATRIVHIKYRRCANCTRIDQNISAPS